MRVPPVTSDDTRKAALAGGGYRDAESLFRTKPISEIRKVESSTRDFIHQKQEELRLLVGTRYRDLIDSADSIVLMKRSSQSISSNLSNIHSAISSLSEDHPSATATATAVTTPRDPSRSRIYGVACRVKYLVDTPENIWGCLDESMFLEAAARYVRARHVHLRLDGDSDHRRFLSNFPLLQHQWQIVESFKTQISQRARDRLFDRDLGIASYADALAAVAAIDDLVPDQVLGLFLDTRKAWVSQTLGGCPLNADCSEVISVFCEALRIIQVSVGHVGELFLRVLNDMPLFYKVVLDSPPASQLFGGIPNPEEEVKLWNSFRDKLESVMVMLDKDYIAKVCSFWLRECGREMVDKINGRFLIDAVGSGRELASAEKLIRETIESKEVLEGSLEWLKSVFGSDIELPWSRMRELVLGDDSDLWDEIFEEAFVGRMKVIVESRFVELSRAMKVADTIQAIGDGSSVDFIGYLNRPSTGGGVWFIDSTTKKASAFDNEFRSCLNAYFGPEVSRIRDAVDSSCESVVEDLLSFLDSPKASPRLKDLVPYVQSKCFESMSTILTEVKGELENLFAVMESSKERDGQAVERALFIGRLLFAIQSYSRHIPVILGPPMFWINGTVSAIFDKSPSSLRLSRTAAAADSPLCDSPGRQAPLASRRQTSSVTSALLGAGETASPKLEELNTTLRDLCIRAHSLWISWLSDELSVILSHDLGRDDALSLTTPLRGWEETVVKQEQSHDSQSELKISLPSMPSLYIVSFLFRACEEVHRIGGHVLDKTIMRKFAERLLEKVIGIYEDFLSSREAGGSELSEKGVLQVLLDLGFVADVLSGGDPNITEELSRVPRVKSPFRRKHDKSHTKSVVRDHVDGMINRLSQRLDPIDWLT
ncbi:hypothetical protein FEM48_Zijuj02G0000900 [Ziziphus jujuba var. spinosa]|nr:hypothetical protein FEM48_Zijuj02G0000900 [Ziziphus jujuba var. spinosa]